MFIVRNMWTAVLMEVYGARQPKCLNTDVKLILLSKHLNMCVYLDTFEFLVFFVIY